MRRHNIYDVPKGKALVNRRCLSVTTATPQQRDRARSRSFVATCKLRHKLLNTDVALVDDSWCHVVRGKVVAKFANMNAAIDAL
jgi:hypothetical protein